MSRGTWEKNTVLEIIPKPNNKVGERKLIKSMTLGVKKKKKTSKEGIN